MAKTLAKTQNVMKITTQIGYFWISWLETNPTNAHPGGIRQEIYLVGKSHVIYWPKVMRLVSSRLWRRPIGKIMELEITKNVQIVWCIAVMNLQLF